MEERGCEMAWERGEVGWMRECNPPNMSSVSMPVPGREVVIDDRGGDGRG